MSRLPRARIAGVLSLVAWSVSAHGCLLDVERGRYVGDASRPDAAPSTGLDDANASAPEGGTSAPVDGELRSDAGSDASSDASAAPAPDDGGQSARDDAGQSARDGASPAPQPDAQTPPEPPVDAGPPPPPTPRCTAPHYVALGRSANPDLNLGSKRTDEYVYLLDARREPQNQYVRFCRLPGWPPQQYAIRFDADTKYWSTRPRDGKGLATFCACADAPLDEHERFRVYAYNSQWTELQSAATGGWISGDDSPATLVSTEVNGTLFVLKRADTRRNVDPAELESFFGD